MTFILRRLTVYAFVNINFCMQEESHDFDQGGAQIEKFMEATVDDQYLVRGLGVFV